MRPIHTRVRSGHVGGRLVPLLEERGERVRCLARRPELLVGRFAAATELVAGDVLDPASLRGALAGVATAYYLVHALGSRGRFEEEEERAAHAFAAAARAAGVSRIVYLGGLVTAGTALPASAHMRSRLRVGEILRACGIPTVEFRASIVIGAGSLSFEMIRALVQRLPIMVTPRWVTVQAQPIAIGDVLAYLVAALDLPSSGARVFEIGGGAVTTYRGLMQEYARQRGTRRLFLPVPLLTPHLSSLWLGLVTPLFARVGRKLIESITLPSVVRDPGAAHTFAIRPCDYRSAIRRALADEDARFVATRWADSRSALAGVPRRWGGVRFGTRLVDSRTVTATATPAAAFAPVQGIGGAHGWYYGNALWRLRGVLDRLVGGPGMKRGRRDATTRIAAAPHRAPSQSKSARILAGEPPGAGASCLSLLPQDQRKPRIGARMTLYLDTSVISALFDERNPERQALTKDFFEGRTADRLLVSELTLAEVENTPSEDLRRSMRAITDRYDVVSVTEDAERLAHRYVEAGAVGSTYAADAYHIAIAVVCTADILVSWNFRHIVRRKTRDIVNMINTAVGYPHLEIVSPGELL